MALKLDPLVQLTGKWGTFDCVYDYSWDIIVMNSNDNINSAINDLFTGPCRRYRSWKEMILEAIHKI